jgi:alpha-L-rhamnosidase
MKKPRFPGITRRRFLQSSAGLAGALPLLASADAGAGDPRARPGADPGAEGQGTQARLPDLRPARWIWYPSGRCLPCTFVLFRKEIELPAAPRRARGWILADSRYLLSVNGKRIQWGPAPSDPRWMEVDPLDLTDALQQGQNVLGAQVLFYGHGDGTWPAGKPGFLFWLEIEIEGAPPGKVVSDASWRSCLARSWRPGHYKRWYLRALQEDYDARLHLQHV